MTIDKSNSYEFAHILLDMGEAMLCSGAEINRVEETFLKHAEVFVEMDAEMKEELINSFSDFELRQVLEELYADDTADIIEEMPATVVRRILKNSSNQVRKEINELLKY